MTIRISFSDKTVRVAVEINGEIESAITYLPQRPWVGLAVDEIQALIEDLRLNHKYCPKEVILQAADVIEALLKECNT
jgi:hypothetical protein